jgi:4-amino-4-deoxy-L-arabinose transferase-like glycosyltransferase
MNRLRLQALMLFSSGLLASLLFCWLIFPLLGETSSGIDPDGYGSAGQVWYASGQFRAIDKAPLYPAFIALLAWLTGGHRLWVVQVAQCLLWALTVVILFAIFRRTLTEDDRLPFVAGLVCALFPTALWYTPRLWTETFLTFGIALYTLSLIALLQQPGALQALLCGLAAGFVALSKGIALIFTPLTLLVLVIYFRRSAWRWVVLFSLAALLWILPWSWRNWQATRALLPIHIDSGYNAYLGNGFTRHWHEAPFSYVELKARTMQDLEQAYPEPAVIPVEPVQRDRWLLRIALNEMIETPSLLLRKVLIQSLTFWYLAADFPKSALVGGLQMPLALLAIAGVRRGWRSRSWALSLMIPVCGVIGVSVLVLAFARLSSTIVPYCLGLAFYGLWPWVGERLTRLTPE